MAFLNGREVRRSPEDKHKQEMRDRLTAVKRVQIDHFSDHVQVEGYVGSGQTEHSFGCDRLLKIETMYSKMQLGYNPNQNKSFLTMSLKTSRYDTIDSQYQKEINEEQMKPLSRTGFQNRVYTSKKKSSAAVFVEKSDTRPWSEATMRPHFGKGNLESLQKTMPFFSRRQEKVKIISNRRRQRELQKKVQDNIKQGNFSDNTVLRKEQREMLYEDNLLNHFIQLKNAESRYFFQKINFAFETQKNEMFEYYKNRKAEKQGDQEEVNDQPTEDGENDD